MSDPLEAARDAAERLSSSLPGELSECLCAFSASMAERTPILDLARKGLAHLVEGLTFPINETSSIDGILSEWRTWASVWGVEILPREWRYDTPMRQSTLCDDESETLIVYRPDAELGTVFRVRAFGFAVLGHIREKAQVSVSAGPAPVELAELEELVRDGTDDIERSLAARLKGFRAASLAGTLEPLAVQLFVDFVDRDCRNWDEAKSEDFRDRLLVLLHEEFGISPIFPTSFHDYPDGWLRIPDGVWMQTGRVTRVIRPGLMDREGRLRVPARVEVE